MHGGAFGAFARGRVGGDAMMMMTMMTMSTLYPRASARERARGAKERAKGAREDRASVTAGAALDMSSVSDVVV